MLHIGIELVSSFECAWCLITYEHLKTAINLLPTNTRVSIRWTPMMMFPDMEESTYGTVGQQDSNDKESEVEQLLTPTRIVEYGIKDLWIKRIGLEMVQESAQVVTAFGRSFGREIPQTQSVGSFAEVHAVMELAAKHGRQTALADVIFEKFWFENVKVYRRRELLEVASKFVPREEILNIFRRPEVVNNMRKSIQERANRIDNTPIISFNNGEIALVGGHSCKDFLRVFAALGCRVSRKAVRFASVTRPWFSLAKLREIQLKQYKDALAEENLNDLSDTKVVFARYPFTHVLRGDPEVPLDARTFVSKQSVEAAMASAQIMTQLPALLLKQEDDRTKETTEENRQETPEEAEETSSEFDEDSEDGFVSDSFDDEMFDFDSPGREADASVGKLAADRNVLNQKEEEYTHQVGPPDVSASVSSAARHVQQQRRRLRQARRHLRDADASLF